MSSQLYISINDNFFIKNNISSELLDKCFAFIESQSGVKRNLIEKTFKKKILHSIEFPKKINSENIDIVIKTKYNKDYKFISLSKSLIFYECNYKTSIFMNKINKFKLDKINFFPSTNLSGNIVYQQLAKGNFYQPNKFSNRNSLLLKNISKVIDNLSSMKKKEVKIANYLNNFKFSKRVITDSLNTTAINNFFLFLKKNQDQNIVISLTHGDLKFEHLFILDNQLEYVIDWENADVRSIFFDLLNFFIPWFVRRSYDYIQIKKYIFVFIQKYLPNLESLILKRYDIYFSIYGLERYKRMLEVRTIEFDLDAAYKRYHLLLNKLSEELNREH
tara:strand:+ start:5988 stop:6983 length:996 start_codon:yes stop_codon:yes gene_type:complete